MSRPMHMKKEDRRPAPYTVAQVKRMCEHYMLRGCAITAIGFSEELLLDKDAVLACVDRANRYDQADKDNLVKLDEMLKIFCESRGLEGFKW